MKRDRTGTATERALVRMLMENTGRHFLDSGGAYGRRWERNQATGMWRAADWLATPEITAEGWSATEESEGVEVSSDAWPTLSVFHYLRRRLAFDSQLTAWLIREGERTDEPWLVSMEAWCKDRHEDSNYGAVWDLGSDNTYNVENLLSQDFQYVRFTYRDEPYVALQIHGGCDARGGYTRPKVFRVTTDEAWSLFDFNKWSFGHAYEHDDSQEPLPGLPSLPEPEQHHWEREGGSYGGWIDPSDGTHVTLDAYADAGHLAEDGKSLLWERRDGGAWRPRCPLCGAPCDIYPPDAW